MYILGGVDVVEMGQIKVFVQELGLKQGFLADTNMDYLTSELPGTPNFKVDANFDVFPDRSQSDFYFVPQEIHSQAGSTSVPSKFWVKTFKMSFKIVRTTASYFFSPSGHGKWAKKVFFRIFANYSNANIFKRYPRMPYES